MMVSGLITNAARAGCRMGALPTSDNSTITTAVNMALSNASISGATTTISVNSSPVNANTALQGDIIAVTVSVPYDSVSWLPSGLSKFLGGQNLVSTEVMRRE